MGPTGCPGRMPPTRSLRPKAGASAPGRHSRTPWPQGSVHLRPQAASRGICLLNPQSTQRTKSPRSVKSQLESKVLLAWPSTPHLTLGPEAWTQTGRRAEIIPSGEKSSTAPPEQKSALQETWRPS